MPGESANDAGLTTQQEVRRCLYLALDRFATEVKTRFNQMKLCNETFNFLSVKSLLNVGINMENTKKFREIYGDDVDFDDLKVEVERIQRLSKATSTLAKDASAVDFFSWLCKMQLTESTPNLCICLKLYLTVSLSVASCERSFSKLKLIKTYLRNTMGQDRLSALALISIEGGSLSDEDLEKIISSFAAAKSRKVNL